MIVLNPSIDLSGRNSAILYFDDGVALFKTLGNPEGLVACNAGSLATDASGNVYRKTTNLVATGWQSLGGGGGSGTVTSVDVTGISGIITTSGGPVTTAGAIALALSNQNANRVFAGPGSGGAAAPTFRALVVADIPNLTSNVTNAIAYDNGGGFFIDTDGLLVDPLTLSLIAGKVGTATGKLILRSTVANQVTLTPQDTTATSIIKLPASATPSVGDLLRVTSVAAGTVVSDWATPTAEITINPTDGVIPYRSSSAGFADSQLSRTASGIVLTGANANLFNAGANGATNPVLQIDSSVASVATGLVVKGNAAGGRVDVDVLSSATNESVRISSKGNLGVVLRASGNAGTLVQFLNNSTNSEAVLFSGALGGFFVRSDALFAFGSGTNVSGSDTALARLAAGVVRLSNASSGIGQLQVAASGITQRGNLHVEPSANTLPALWMSFPSNTGSDAPIDAGRRSRGTNASPTAVQDGDILRIIRASGQFSTTDASFTPGAEIRMVAKETWSGSQNGAQLEFYTAPLGGGGIAQVGKFHASGAFCVGANPTTVNAVNKLVVGNSIGFNTDVVSCQATGSVDTTTTASDLQIGASSTAYFQRYFELGDSTARGRVNVNGQHEQQVGRSGTYARTKAVWQSNITPASNSGAGETTLHSYTIGGNSLRVDKDGIRVRGAGRVAANVNAKQLRFKFGATTFGDTGSVVMNGGNFTFDAEIVRTGATAQVCFITVNSMLAGVVGVFGLTNSTTAAETLSGSVTLAITGQGAASSDITLDYSRVEYNPATI